MAQRPLRKHKCDACTRNFYSRSPLSRFCSVQCQVKTWRQANKSTHAELERKFIEQEDGKQDDKQEAA